MSGSFEEQLDEVRKLRRERWLQERAKETSSRAGGKAEQQEDNVCKKAVEGDVSKVMTPVKSTSPKERRKRQLGEGSATKKTKRLKLVDGKEPATKTESLDDLVLLSWNLDGLMEKELPGRTLAVIDQIRNSKPALVLLQEVVSLSETLIRKYLSAPYTVLEPSTRSDWTPDGQPKSSVEKQCYYCLMLVSKYHFKPCSTSRTYFYPKSAMGRHLMTAELEWQSSPAFKVLVGTSHFESCKDQKEERMNQMQTCIEWMSSELIRLPDNSLVLLAGDFNTRDTEVKLKQDVMDGLGIKDAWLETGCSKTHQYSWDMLKNKNLEAKGRCRFDRVWFWRGEHCPVALKSFELVGTNIIDPKALPMHPSDHFGLLSRFTDKY